MALRPDAHRREQLAQGLAKWGQGILDPWRHHIVHGAHHQPVSFQAAQRLSQDLLRDPRNFPPQLTVPMGALGQRVEHQRGPLLGQQS